MKIIIAHNKYRTSSPSGENIAVAREIELLRQNKQNFYLLEQENDQLDSSSFLNKLRTFSRMVKNRSLRVALKKTLAGFTDANILHAHNVMPMLTYELFVAAKELGLTTIQTLHNYRLVANQWHYYTPNGPRQPKSTSEKAELKYMNPTTRGVLEPIYDHAYQKIWSDNYLSYIDKFICMTQFQKNLLIKLGLPATKLVIKSNFLSQTIAKQQTTCGSYAIFVGRLTAEKGILSLCESWSQLPFPLYVVGSGPLKKALPHRANIFYINSIDNAQVLELMRAARFLVMNSQGFEVCPLVLLEALSCGLPCLVPNLGPMAEIITDQQTGLVFEPSDPSSLIRAAQQLWEQAPNMKSRCHQEYQNRFTPEQNWLELQKIYATAN